MAHFVFTALVCIFLLCAYVQQSMTMALSNEDEIEEPMMVDLSPGVGFFK